MLLVQSRLSNSLMPSALTYEKLLFIYRCIVREHGNISPTSRKAWRAWPDSYKHEIIYISLLEPMHLRSWNAFKCRKRLYSTNDRLISIGGVWGKQHSDGSFICLWKRANWFFKILIFISCVDLNHCAEKMECFPWKRVKNELEYIIVRKGNIYWAVTLKSFCELNNIVYTRAHVKIWSQEIWSQKFPLTFIMRYKFHGKKQIFLPPPSPAISISTCAQLTNK